MNTAIAPARNAARTSVLDLDSPGIRSYAIEANLIKAMAEAGVDHQVRHQVVRTPKGRWTVLVLGFQQGLLGSGFPMIG
jgi:hypothetical protein